MNALQEILIFCVQLDNVPQIRHSGLSPLSGSPLESALFNSTNLQVRVHVFANAAVKEVRQAQHDDVPHRQHDNVPA